MSGPPVSGRVARPVRLSRGRLSIAAPAYSRHGPCAQVGVTGWTALKLRQKAVAWLNKNGDRPMDDGKVGQRTLLKDSVGVDSWSSYLSEMSQHGRTWGDEATLLAISVLFGAEICVISSLSEDYCHIVTPPDVWRVELRTRIYLGHFAEYHYVSTRPI